MDLGPPVRDQPDSVFNTFMVGVSTVVELILAGDTLPRQPSRRGSATEAE